MRTFALGVTTANFFGLIQTDELEIIESDVRTYIAGGMKISSDR